VEVLNTRASIESGQTMEQRSVDEDDERKRLKIYLFYVPSSGQVIGLDSSCPI
jgi:hypothetical protein